MAEFDLKQQIQEDEYDVPYHWLAVGFDRRGYDFKSAVAINTIKRHTANRGGIAVLDAGCGDGRFTSKLTKEFNKVHGVDMSDRALRFAKVLAPSASYTCGRIENLNVKGKFDVVTAIDVIEHISPEQRHAFLVHVKKLLKPQGIALFIVPSSRLRVIPKHFMHYSPRDIHHLAQQEGFRVTDMIGLTRAVPFFQRLVKFFSWPGIGWFGRKLLRTCAPRKGADILFVLQKND